jgi:hypothetical protein
MQEDQHPLREELLLAADGELPRSRAAQVAAHLQVCWECRASLQEIETAIADFVRTRHDYLDSQLPPAQGPRALLKASLHGMSPQPSMQRFHPMALAAAVVIVLCGALVVRLSVNGHPRLEAPRVSLTPGLARNVTWAQVCSDRPRVSVVPANLRHQVFEEYGLRDAGPRVFEVDYLITPELGGAEDIRNLWPQPYSATVWNARVKDALEEHLHQMVCAGQLDLTVAQHDIATDWIAAYKKYFHTDRPLQRLDYDQ